MKKRMEMETKIAVTFVIVAVVGIIIGGILNVIGKTGNFISFDGVACGAILGMFHLGVIFRMLRFNIRRYKLLVTIAIIDFVIGCICVTLDITSKTWDEFFSTTNCGGTFCIIITMIIVSIIAVYQSRRLLEESMNVDNVDIIDVEYKIIESSPEDDN